MEEGFEVEGPERHAVEHSAHAGDTLAARIAVMTAILSTVGAMAVVADWDPSLREQRRVAAARSAAMFGDQLVQAPLRKVGVAGGVRPGKSFTGGEIDYACELHAAIVTPSVAGTECYS